MDYGQFLELAKAFAVGVVVVPAILMWSRFRKDNPAPPWVNDKRLANVNGGWLAPIELRHTKMRARRSQVGALVVSSPSSERRLTEAVTSIEVLVEGVGLGADAAIWFLKAGSDLATAASSPRLSWSVNQRSLGTFAGLPDERAELGGRYASLAVFADLSPKTREVLERDVVEHALTEAMAQPDLLGAVFSHDGSMRLHFDPPRFVTGDVVMALFARAESLALALMPSIQGAGLIAPPDRAQDTIGASSGAPVATGISERFDR